MFDWLLIYQGKAFFCETDIFSKEKIVGSNLMAELILIYNV